MSNLLARPRPTDRRSPSRASRWQGLSLVLGLLACCVPSRAFAWGSATHAYVADHIGKSNELPNIAEMYGAMVPDLFNTHWQGAANRELAACIRSGTHGYPLTGSDGFGRIWQLARFGFGRSVAFGYVSHNDLWGADNGAHWTSSSGTTPGYTVLKGQQLVAAIQANVDDSGRSAWDYLGITPSPVPLPDPLADPVLLMCHFLIEEAGDVLVRRQDASIGLKVALAAALRPESVKQTLVKLLGGCPTMTASLVEQAEEAFRQQTLTTGLVLLQDESEILEAMTNQLAEQTPAYIEYVTGRPFDPQLQPLLTQVIAQGLHTAVAMIEDDFMAELASITGSLELTMKAHGIGY